MALTIEQFGKSLVAAGLATGDELRAWWTALPAAERPRDADTFAKLWREQGKLSDYQSQVLLQGKPASLTFGSYLLISQLGVGASGTVFKAKHKTNGRTVAIKVLASALSQNEKAVKRFYREMQATARLTHPNIVRAFDAGEFNGQHFLVMEFVEGEDLASRVKSQGPLDVELATRCTLQAARGLEYVHAQGLIHRDMKPGNLLCDRQGNVRILDLGLVRFEDPDEATGDGLTGTQQVMGTIDYMSPEQVVDTRHADARSDEYSLGCTLWFLLTGRKLYDGKGVVDRIMQHRTGAIPALDQERKGVSPQLAAVFAKMVAKQPSDRYATMTEVCAALERALKGEPEPTPAVAEAAEVEEAEVIEEEMATVEAVDDVSFTNLPTVAAAPATETPAFGGFAINTAAPAISVARKPAARPTATSAGASKPKFTFDRRVLIGGGVGLAVLLIGGAVWYWLS